MDPDKLNSEDWNRLYEDYVQAHEERGLDVLNRGEFEDSVRRNIPSVNAIARSIRSKRS